MLLVVLLNYLEINSNNRFALYMFSMHAFRTQNRTFLFHIDSKREKNWSDAHIKKIQFLFSIYRAIEIFLIIFLPVNPFLLLYTCAISESKILIHVVFICIFNVRKKTNLFLCVCGFNVTCCDFVILPPGRWSFFFCLVWFLFYFIFTYLFYFYQYYHHIK